MANAERKSALPGWWRGFDSESIVFSMIWNDGNGGNTGSFFIFLSMIWDDGDSGDTGSFFFGFAAMFLVRVSERVLVRGRKWDKGSEREKNVRNKKEEDEFGPVIIIRGKRKAK